MAFSRRNSKPIATPETPTEKKLHSAGSASGTTRSSTPSALGDLSARRATWPSPGTRSAAQGTPPISSSPSPQTRIANLASTARRSTPEAVLSAKAPAQTATSSTATASTTKNTPGAPSAKLAPSSTTQPTRSGAPLAVSRDSGARSESSVTSTGGSQPAASSIVASWSASTKSLPSARTSSLRRATAPASVAPAPPASAPTAAPPAPAPAAAAPVAPVSQGPSTMPGRVAAVAAAKGPVASVLRDSGYVAVRPSPEDGEGDDGDDGRIVWSAPLSDDDMSDSGTPVRRPAARTGGASFEVSPQRQRQPFFPAAKGDGGSSTPLQESSPLREKSRAGLAPGGMGATGAGVTRDLSPGGYSDASPSPMLSPGTADAAYEAADEEEASDADSGRQERPPLSGWLSAVARGEPIPAVKDAVKESIAARVNAGVAHPGADQDMVGVTPDGDADAALRPARGDEGSDGDDVVGEVDTASASSHTRSASESLEDVDDDFDLTEEERRAEREIAREALLTGGDVGYLETVLEESMEGVESVGSASSPGHAEHNGQGVTHLEGLEEGEEMEMGEGGDAASSVVGVEVEADGEAGFRVGEMGSEAREAVKSLRGSWEDRLEDSTKDQEDELKNIVMAGMEGSAPNGVAAGGHVTEVIGGRPSGANARARGGDVWGQAGQGLGEDSEEQAEDWMDRMIRREMEHRGRFWEQAKHEDERVDYVNTVGLEHIRTGGLATERAGEGMGHGLRGHELEDVHARMRRQAGQEAGEEEDEEVSVRGSRIREDGMLGSANGAGAMDRVDSRGERDESSDEGGGSGVTVEHDNADGAGALGIESEGSVDFRVGHAENESDEEEAAQRGLDGSQREDGDGHSAAGVHEWNVVQENSLYHNSSSGEDEDDSREGEFSPSAWREDNDDAAVDAGHVSKHCRSHSLKRAAAAAAAEAARAREQVRALRRLVQEVGGVGMQAASGVDRAVLVLEKVTVAALAVGDGAVERLHEGVAMVGRVLEEVAVVPADVTLQQVHAENARLKAELETARAAGARAAEEIRELKSSLKLSQVVASGMCSELEDEAAKLRARVGELEGECDVLRQQLELARDETPRSTWGRADAPTAGGIAVEWAPVVAVACETRDTQTDAAREGSVANASTDMQGMAGAVTSRGVEGVAGEAQGASPEAKRPSVQASERDGEGMSTREASGAEAEAELAEAHERAAELAALLAEEKQTTVRLQARLSTGEGRLKELAKLQKSLEEALSSANWQVADLTASMASIKDTELSQGRRIAALERQKQDAEQQAARLSAVVKELEAQEKEREAAPAGPSVAEANAAVAAALASLKATVEDALRKTAKRLRVGGLVPAADGCPHKALWVVFQADEPVMAGDEGAVTATSSSGGTGSASAPSPAGNTKNAMEAASGVPISAPVGEISLERIVEPARHLSERVELLAWLLATAIERAEEGQELIVRDVTGVMEVAEAAHRRMEEMAKQAQGAQASLVALQREKDLLERKLDVLCEWAVTSLQGWEEEMRLFRQAWAAHGAVAVNGHGGGGHKVDSLGREAKGSEGTHEPTHGARTGMGNSRHKEDVVAGDISRLATRTDVEGKMEDLKDYVRVLEKAFWAAASEVDRLEKALQGVSAQ